MMLLLMAALAAALQFLAPMPLRLFSRRPTMLLA